MSRRVILLALTACGDDAGQSVPPERCHAEWRTDAAACQVEQSVCFGTGTLLACGTEAATCLTAADDAWAACDPSDCVAAQRQCTDACDDGADPWYGCASGCWTTFATCAPWYPEACEARCWTRLDLCQQLRSANATSARDLADVGECWSRWQTCAAACEPPSN